ncbi:MAG: S1 RNA-binding domain-containing protein [Marinilabiliales bacterium]|nr:S1 RNA-binding domain-containing protein [Marinilabiliales bacterium]
MSDKIGKVFEGVISGVTEWGLYVEIIENQCEGMIAIRELQDDYFEYDEENYSIRGRQSGKVYMLGDKINVEVAKADLAEEAARLPPCLIAPRRGPVTACLIALYKLKEPLQRFGLRRHSSVLPRCRGRYAPCPLRLPHNRSRHPPSRPDR